MTTPTTTPTTPKTLLEAVNELLRAVRLSGVNSLLPASLTEDASGAKLAIDTASIEVQQEGWPFNKDEDYPLDPEQTTGYILLPANTLRVTASRTKANSKRLVERAGKLWDRTNRTFNIGETVYVDLVLAVQFDELPTPARQYITALAARRFCVPRLPTGATFQYTEEYLKQARAQLENWEAETNNEDLAATSPHFSKMRRR